MSEDFRITGNHEAPDGQSEHQPALRKLTGLLMSSRAAVYCASVVATGVALKPASVSDLTKASLDFVFSGLSVRQRNLISKPRFPESCSSFLAFAVSVTKSPWS